jgi:hypothetical protein
LWLPVRCQSGEKAVDRVQIFVFLLAELSSSRTRISTEDYLKLKNTHTVLLSATHSCWIQNLIGQLGRRNKMRITGIYS